MSKIGLFILIICVISSIAWSVDPSPAPAKETLPATKINPKDGAEMVLVPAGEFLMGSKDDDKKAFNNEKPQHKVNLDSYYIYKTEVTVAQFRKFCRATGRKSMPKKPKWGLIDNHPIVNVSWNDAKAYADWAGVVLPTEAQWEKAARGSDGRIYPWGNEWDKSKCANWSNSGDGKTTYGTHSVGSFPTGDSPYGVMDMSGNAWEWCGDWYGADFYKSSPMMNPTGPISGDTRVLRGGSWYYYENVIDNEDRSACRTGFDPLYINYGIGFRCAVLATAISKEKTAIESPVVVVQPNVLSTDLPKQKINPKDGAEMVLVPAGEFLMGSTDDDKQAFEFEKPQHKVNLDSYYIYKTEVTVAQFRKFCHATGRKSMPPKPKWGWIDNHPIVNVSWYDAKAYADWAGVVLPTEAQWEKAARGTDGRIYPWGNEWDKSKCVNEENSNGKTKPVGSISEGSSPYGCLDMAGNVIEWCRDWFDEEYYSKLQVNNPVGPEKGESRVLRSGSWIDNGNEAYRTAFRYGHSDLHDFINYVGFRCASPVM